MANCNYSSMNPMSRGMCSNDEFPIGMAYVPWQKWRDLYEPDKALKRGTIFAELDKPFLGAQGVKR